MVKIVDQWVLLTVVMAGQDGGRKKAWSAGFMRVNLHPDHKIPIECWLSKISSVIISAGGTESCYDKAYTSEYLRLIKVPAFYQALEEEDQRKLLGLIRHPQFDWSLPLIEKLPEKFNLVRRSRNLVELFAFNNHMCTSMEKGLVRHDELTPAAAIVRAKAVTAQLNSTQKQVTKKEKITKTWLDLG